MASWRPCGPGQATCDNVCPAVDLAARPFDLPSRAPNDATSKAHLFVIGRALPPGA
jgi:hypothetical protein